MSILGSEGGAQLSNRIHVPTLYATWHTLSRLRQPAMLGRANNSLLVTAVGQSQPQQVHRGLGDTNLQDRRIASEIQLSDLNVAQTRQRDKRCRNARRLLIRIRPRTFRNSQRIVRSEPFPATGSHRGRDFRAHSSGRDQHVTIDGKQRRFRRNRRRDYAPPESSSRIRPPPSSHVPAIHPSRIPRQRASLPVRQATG